MKIILSIKPQFVREIFAGRKRFEYRRSICKQPIDTVVIYCSAPVSMIVGEFEVKRIIAESPKTLWQETHNWAGIDKAYFDKYFSEKNKGYAFQIGEVKEYVEPLFLTSICPGAKPPQSFMYLRHEEELVL